MLFSFLKYLQPTHYFGLKTKNGNFVFPKVVKDITSQFEIDHNFSEFLGFSNGLSLDGG